MITQIIIGSGRKRIKIDLWPDMKEHAAVFLKGYLGLNVERKAA